MGWPRYPASASLGQSFSRAALSLLFRPVQFKAYQDWLSKLHYRAPQIFLEIVYFSFVFHPLVEHALACSRTFLCCLQRYSSPLLHRSGAPIPCWMVHSLVAALDSFGKTPKVGWPCLPSRPHIDLVVAHV